ncbi:MAG: serine/threonine protein kinase, partial [Elusimicrobiota bacterium]|nr:serine/threonine protein kinase [Elusimicrobiota bacterium]
MPEENKETAPADAAPQGQQEAPQPAPQSAIKTNPELALIGQEISGCVILEKISSGGMGTVFKARHKALDRIVCVKILSPALADDKKAVGLFLTEARAIAEIDHPNIVFVYNVGREKGFYFIVMSFIDGESLSSIVRKKPNLPVSFIIDTFIGVLRGLEAAHQKGIIHRDIKPSNILINKKLEPKIVDFGIAKKMDKDKGCTKTTELAGTAYFLSPEQALGRPIDTRADLYSVGASLFYVLTGRYPFTGKNSMEIIQKHINEPVPDVSQYRRGLPSWIPAAVSKLMSKNPKDRFQTATETLIFFQKMRADDQLKVSQGVNIADEIGLKISNDGPAADEQPAQARTNRFNADVRGRAVKTPVHIAALGDEPAAAARRPSQGPVSEEFFNARRSGRLRSMELHSKRGLFAFGGFTKGFMLALLAAGMMIAAAAAFLKLGAICAAYGEEGQTFMQAMVAPWVAQEYLPGQMTWACVCFVYIAFTLSMFFFGKIGKIVPVVAGVAVLAYIAAFYGMAPAPLPSLTAYTLLPVYALVLGALGIKIDEEENFKWPARLLGAAFFAAAFYCVYLFFKPQGFEQGPLTASLLYSSLGLMAAAAALQFLRGSFIYRLAAIGLFAAACASIWVYQASGNVYYMMKEADLQPSAAEQQQQQQPAQEEEARAYNI